MSVLFTLLPGLAMAADEDVPDLTLDNVILQLTKHKFPATKWAELATHLHQEDDDPSPQLADVIERWLATNDENKSWRGLVDAVVRCKEMAVAKPLAHEVKVPFPGAHRQWTPSKPSQHTTESMTGNNTEGQQQQQQQSSDGPPPPPAESGNSSSSSTTGGGGGGGRSSVRTPARQCRGGMIEPILAFAGASAYYFIGDQKRSAMIGNVLFGFTCYAILSVFYRKQRGSTPINVGGVKVPPRVLAAVGGFSLGCLHSYIRR